MQSPNRLFITSLTITGACNGSADLVDESPGNGLTTFAPARRSTERYVRNIAMWLAGRR